MAPVAERLGLGVLAVAEIVVFLVGSELDGPEGGALVGSVAEGLGLRQSARAPIVVLAHFQLDPA